MDKEFGKVTITAECFAGFVERAAQAESEAAFERDKRWRAEAELEQIKRENDAMRKALQTAEGRLALYEELAGVANGDAV